MPLKLLEYLSTGKITIVADVPLYNQVFLKDFQPFYYTPGDPESLYDSICSAVRLKDLDKHLVAGVEFAANFTWDNRTLNMLSAVDSL
jgi:glycosyltransferase involved in cell wall biosynthesis